MYCLRHFLPMYSSLTPLPFLYELTNCDSLFLSSSVSPYFVLLLAISFAFAHRPWYDFFLCALASLISTFSIYCSVILITLFSTSCYWSERCLLDLNNGNIFTARPPPDPRSLGVGIGWLRALMGNRTWRFPCVGVKVVA